MPIDKAVHMECMPVDPLAEAEWVEGVIAARRSPAVATVAACDLAADGAAEQLRALKARCPSVVGVRCVRASVAVVFVRRPARRAAGTRKQGRRWARRRELWSERRASPETTLLPSAWRSCWVRVIMRALVGLAATISHISRARRDTGRPLSKRRTTAISQRARATVQSFAFHFIALHSDMTLHCMT